MFSHLCQNLKTMGFFKNLLGKVVDNIPVIGDLASGIFQNQADVNAANANRDFAKGMAEWQNMYNSPVEQMSRLKAAGLNPNLVYGSGSSITPSAAVNTSSQPAPRVPQLGQAASLYFDTRIKREQSQNMEAMRNKMNAETAAIGVKMAGNLVANARNRFEFGKAIDTRDAYVRSANATAANLEATTGVLGHQSDLTRAKAAGQLELNKGVELDNVRKTIENKFVDERQRQAIRAADMGLVKMFNEIIQSKANVDYTLIQQRLAKWELFLNTKGVSRTDPAVIRFFALWEKELQNANKKVNKN